MISKAVVPVAGLGTRLLSATKDQPKEMLPIFSSGGNGMLCIKPMVQEIFEQLFDIGIRSFCFVVGREKRAIQDHFTPSPKLIDRLNGLKNVGQVLQLESFFRKIEESTIVWVEQPQPLGFGDAVLRAERYVGEEHFLVNAGDSYVTSELYDVPKRLTSSHLENRADATLTLKKVEDPSHYGVAEVIEERGRTFVRRVIEKPCTLGNKLAIVALYAFGPCIFSALTDIKPGRGGEVQLTDAIQVLIDRGSTVQAIKLQTNDVHVDIGNPDSYWEALRISHHDALSRRGRVESLPSILRSTSGHISTETRVERTQEYACEVCGALAMEGDILCNDCSRNFEVVFELVRNHPELSMRDLERMKGILELTGRTLISQRPKVETTADHAILRQRTKRIAVK